MEVLLSHIGRVETEIKKGMQVMGGINFTPVADNRIRVHANYRNRAYHYVIEPIIFFFHLIYISI